MTQLSHDLKPKLARGPDGHIMCINDLPPPDTTRWVVRRKAEVVWAVRGRIITVEQACERYRLSPEEFEAWVALVRTEGIDGLRATRPRENRRVAPDKSEVTG